MKAEGTAAFHVLVRKAVVLVSAMCGRLSVGKDYRTFCRAGRCGHVFDLLVRRAWPLAIMPSARTGPGQLHALEALWPNGFSRSSVRPAGCVTFVLPFPSSSAGFA